MIERFLYQNAYLLKISEILTKLRIIELKIFYIKIKENTKNIFFFIIFYFLFIKIDGSEMYNFG